MKSPFLLQTLTAALVACLLMGCDTRARSKKEIVVEKKESSIKSLNRLATSNSTLLKRHASDPVDWFPWGPEAFQKATDESKLVMLCIGYSSCPWTLRMQRDSYKNPKTAEYLNKHYICILVDREERPDINNSFMKCAALQAGVSGWPLHVWMIPSGEPVNISAYLPKHSVPGRAGFDSSLEQLMDRWPKDTDYLTRSGKERAEAFRSRIKRISTGDLKSKLDRSMLDLAYDKFRSIWDSVNGGFSVSPKFHQSEAYHFLLDYASDKKLETFGRSDLALEMVKKNLRSMGAGALHDPLSGGFFRYSVDSGWTFPAFEKMLYDQSYTTYCYIRAYQYTNDAELAGIALQTLDYVSKELSHPEGGFFCAENPFNPDEYDAGTDNLGSYYTWKKAEIASLVSPEVMSVLTPVFGLDDDGNISLEARDPQNQRHPGRNVLRLVTPFEEVAKKLQKPVEEVRKLYEQGRETLLKARKSRPRPVRDQKIIPSWNASMISTFIHASGAFKDPALLARAERAMEITLKSFLSESAPRIRFAEDYTMLVQMLLDHYEATGNAKSLQQAIDLQARFDKELWDEEGGGGYWDGPSDPNLFVRIKFADEVSEFVPNATAASNLNRLARLTAHTDYFNRAAQIFTYFAGSVAGSPQGLRTPSGPVMHIRLLTAYDHFTTNGFQYALVGSKDDPLVTELRSVLLGHFRKACSILHLDGAESETLLTKLNPDLAKLRPANLKAGIVVAQQFMPVKTITTAKELKAFLDEAY